MASGVSHGANEDSWTGAVRRAKSLGSVLGRLRGVAKGDVAAAEDAWR